MDTACWKYVWVCLDSFTSPLCSTHRVLANCFVTRGNVDGSFLHLLQLDVFFSPAIEVEILRT